MVDSPIDAIREFIRAFEITVWGNDLDGNTDIEMVMPADSESNEQAYNFVWNGKNTDRWDICGRALTGLLEIIREDNERKKAMGNGGFILVGMDKEEREATIEKLTELMSSGDIKLD